MKDLLHKSKDELIEEIRLLRDRIEKGNIVFPGISVINKYERTINQNEDKYREFFISANDGIILLQKNIIIECNGRAAELFSTQVKNLIGKNICDLSPKLQPDGTDSKNKCAHILREVQNHNPAVVYWKFEREKGVLFDAEVSFKYFKAGSQFFTQAIIRDVSERISLYGQIHNLEQKREEEQFFTNSGVWEFDLKKLNVKWSPAIYAIHQLPPDKDPPNLNKYFDKYIDPKDRDFFFATIQEIIRSGRDFKMDYRIVLPNKSVRHLHAWCKPVKDETGETVKIVGNLQDISERKELENQLYEKKESYKNLVENLPEGVVIYEPNKILYANKGAYEIAKVKKPGLFEKSDFRIFDFLLPQFHHEISRKINLIMKGRRYGPVELKLKTGEGKLVEIEARSTPIVYQGRQAIQVIFNDISYRKHVERSLKESERQLSTLISNLPGMAYRCKNDRNWTMEYVSEGCYKLVGYTSQELTSNRTVSFNDLIWHEDREPVWNAVQEALGQNTTFTLTYRVVHKNGSIKWVYEQGKGVFNEEKKLLALEGLITDITVQQNIQEELQQSKETYQNLVQFLPEGIIIHQHGKVVYGNNAALRVFGIRSAEQIIGLNVFDFVLEPYHEGVKERIKGAYQGQEQGYFELKIKTIDGKELDAETRSIPYLYQGQPSVLVVIHNLSQEKMLAREKLRAQVAEETNETLKREILEKEKARVELLQSQSYIRNIINSSLDMIIANNSELKITEFNKAAQIVFGYKTEEVIGKPIYLLYSNQKEFERVNKVIINEGVYTGEIKNKRKNGEPFDSFLTATGLYNEEGVLIGGMGVSRDMSLIKKEREKLRLSEERYKAILNQAFVGIGRLSIDLNFLQANERLQKMTGYSETELQKQHLLTLFKEEEKPAIKQLIKLITKEKLPNTVTENRMQTKDGKELVMNINISLILNPAGAPDYFVIVFDDVTEQKQDQARIYKQTAKLTSIIENSSFMVMSVDKNIQLVSYNSVAAEWLQQFYGVTARQGLALNKKPVYSNKANNNLWLENIEAAFDGKPVFFESLAVDKRKKSHHLEVYINPVFSEDQSVNEVSAICFDVTEKKKAQEKIDTQRAKFNAIFDNSSHQIYTIDRKLKLTSFNLSFYNRAQKDYNLEVFTGMDMKQVVLRNHDAERGKTFLNLHKKALEGHRLQTENKVISVNGGVTYYQIYLDPIFLPDGSIHEVSYLVHDITDRKLADKKIIESLKEKEVLLKEVHHRVKNNLQVISSIINLQRSYLNDDRNEPVFVELQNRIKSMSYIHESLYQKGDFNKLDFTTYVKHLTENLKNTYATGQHEIQLVVVSDPVFLNLDYSIPCGLIVNELVSNAFKYAFPGNNKGRVTVALHKKGQEVSIGVSDNGVGIPDEVDIFHTVTLGLQLVTSLVDQINGKLSYKKLKSGTSLTVSFNIAN